MLAASINTYSQITLNARSTSVKSVINNIEKQTDYRFFFEDNLPGLSQKVNINVKDKSINYVLDRVLSQTGISYTIKGNNQVVIYSAKEAVSQQSATKLVKGVIVDSSKAPIIGANIMVKGTTQGTITDMDGKFELDVPVGAILKISYIGFINQEVKIGKNSNLSITLKEDTETLDEVVVVGFGTQKKVNLTGAVNSVDIDKALGDRPLTTVTAALQGAVPGLRIDTNTSTPGASPGFNIRGTTSINGGSPLVLVNNVPMDINMVDPQEIESVSVLKDAASSAIYGARAAYGVILITTKHGRKDSKPSFNYNNSFSFSSPLELPEKASPLESVRAYKHMDFPNGNYVDGTNIEQWEQHILEYNADPSKYPLGYMFDESGNLFKMANNDMLKDMMENFGFQQNHSMSVSGGSEKTTYRIGLGYTNEDGILITDKDKFSRVNLSSFIGVDVNKWLTTQLDIKYASSDKSQVEVGGRGGIWNSGLAASFEPVSDAEIDGKIYPIESPRTYILNGEPRKIKNNNFRALGRIILKPFKNFKVTGEYTFNRKTNKNSLYTNIYEYAGKNTAQILKNVQNSSYAITQGFANYTAINLYANYSLQLKKHELDFMVGFNQEESHNESQYSTKNDVFITTLPSLGTASGTAITSDSFSEYALRGVFYRINYNYADKYLFEANGRYDGSSRFPKDSRFGFFPSFSGAWRISEEGFMEDVKEYVSNLKFRVSWGEIGNQVVGNNYPYIPTMNPYLSGWLVNDEKITTLGVPPMVSSNFGWETVRNFNVGLDFSLFNNRLDTSVEWYRRKTLGMLAPGMELPSVVGASAARQNAADLKTYGWELNMNWKDRINDFRYSIGFNLYDSQAEITKFDNKVGAIGPHRKGQKLGEIWGFVTDRLATEDDFNPDGSLKPGIPIYKGQGKLYPGDVIYKNFDEDTETIFIGENTIDNPGDRKIIGNTTPRFLYGITGSMSYKGFDFSFLLRGVGKRDFWRNDSMAWPTGSWGGLFKENLDFWTPDNVNAFYPRAYAQDGTNTSFNHKVQTRYLTNGAYLKIQNITLGYTLPKRWVSKLTLNKVKVFVTGENLYTFDHLPKGLEPENNAQWNYPFMRKVSFGVNVNF